MERAFLAGFAGFTSGILCCSFFLLAWWFPVMLALMGVLVLGTASFSKRKTLLLCAITMLAAAIGMGRVTVMPSSLPESLMPLLETTASLEGVVVGEPDIRETTQRVPVQVRIQKEETTVLAVLPLFPRIERGDRIRVTGKIVSPEPFETDTGRTFRYDRFLAKDGIFALVEHGHAEHIET
ncbi:MAG: ComEC/Rec2 family competence protein, partial [Nitrospirota bacterium]|nr:ComEC/Rec2 family competence protein [Nitrospirota bacterium]